jgi:alanyl-tRNA synthetase
VDLDANSVKDICFQMKSEIDNLFLVLAYEQKGKAMISVALSNNMVADKQLSAVDIVNELAQEVGGRGGGQPFFATAGGSKLSGIEKALSKARALFS